LGKKRHADLVSAAIMDAKISEIAMAELAPTRALLAAQTEIFDPRSKGSSRLSCKRTQEARGRAFPWETERSKGVLVYVDDHVVIA
jgi:hypothetical protein